MAAFNTSKLIDASSSLIPTMGERIVQHFKSEDYEVEAISLSNGGYDISITKGGLFKAVLGMKTALKVSLMPKSGKVFFDAGVGIFGQQAIPTVISMFFFWPVLITQIWGLVEQSRLDDEALKIAESVAQTAPVATAIIDIPSPSDYPSSSSNPSASSTSSPRGRFCTNCGHQISGTEKFCPECGNKL